MKIIYLDFNHWITLSRIAIGKETKPELKQIYYFIEKKLENNEICVPLSLTHLLELATSSENVKRKLIIAETMVKFSQGYTIPPYTTLLRYEIDNAIIDRLLEHGNQKQQQEIKELKKNLETIYRESKEYTFLGKGIPHLLGSTLQAENKHTGEVIQQKLVNLMNEYLTTPKIFLELITTPELQTMGNQMKQEFMDIVNGYKEDVAHLRKVPKSQRISAMKGYFLLKIGVMKIITKKYLYWCERFNFEIKKDKTLLFCHKGEKLINKKATDDFIESIPILDAFLLLSMYYLKHFDRDITSNDLFDISFLCLAIPYSDIVICDKFFAKGSKILQLDSIYKAEVAHKLQILDDLL